jgi:hypothetical protein
MSAPTQKSTLALQQELQAVADEARQKLSEVLEKTNQQAQRDLFVSLIAILLFGLVLMVASCGDDLLRSRNRRGRGRNEGIEMLIEDEEYDYPAKSAGI